MTEPDHDRLIRIEEAVETIKKGLSERPLIRHIDKDGICDAYNTVRGHEARFNQWVGFTAGISALSALIGGAIMAAIAWLKG